MNKSLVSFMLAIGVSTWVYTKMLKSTGHNIKGSVVVASVTFIAVFVVGYIMLGFVPNGTGDL